MILMIDYFVVVDKERMVFSTLLRIIGRSEIGFKFAFLRYPSKKIVILLCLGVLIGEMFRLSNHVLKVLRILHQN